MYYRGEIVNTIKKGGRLKMKRLYILVICMVLALFFVTTAHSYKGDNEVQGGYCYIQISAFGCCTSTDGLNWVNGPCYEVIPCENHNGEPDGALTGNMKMKGDEKETPYGEIVFNAKGNIVPRPEPSDVCDNNLCPCPE